MLPIPSRPLLVIQLDDYLMDMNKYIQKLRENSLKKEIEIDELLNKAIELINQKKKKKRKIFLKFNDVPCSKVV